MLILFWSFVLFVVLYEKTKIVASLVVKFAIFLLEKRWEIFLFS